ncbi:hypothetical protein COLO4_12802 [Corchorus olitorius]|uniref:DUF4283 domain-containing protein n=1 Tax=Corchorus olitorius TaxID=93759 RepID=A0A1R3JZH7_9ROSI|nr:hypothetical protein COLO4_12802 [Corchorus olitorius]
MEFGLEISLEANKEEVSEATKYALIGKIGVDRALNRKGVVGVLQSILSTKDLIDVMEIGENLYGLLFSNKEVMSLALERGPWTVMGHCLSLKKWEVEKSVKELCFDEVNFCIQVHHLPWEMQTMANAEKIGRNVGRILEVESLQWGQGIGRGFLRIRVAVKVNKPLIGGFSVPKGNVKRIVEICLKTRKKLKVDTNCGGVWMRTNVVMSMPRKVEEKGAAELDMPSVVVNNAGILSKGRWRPVKGKNIVQDTSSDGTTEESTWKNEQGCAELIHVEQMTDNGVNTSGDGKENAGSYSVKIL